MYSHHFLFYSLSHPLLKPAPNSSNIRRRKNKQPVKGTSAARSVSTLASYHPHFILSSAFDWTECTTRLLYWTHCTNERSISLWMRCKWKWCECGRHFWALVRYDIAFQPFFTILEFSKYQYTRWILGDFLWRRRHPANMNCRFIPSALNAFSWLRLFYFHTASIHTHQRRHSPHSKSLGFVVVVVAFGWYSSYP